MKSIKYCLEFIYGIGLGIKASIVLNKTVLNYEGEFLMFAQSHNDRLITGGDRVVYLGADLLSKRILVFPEFGLLKKSSRDFLIAHEEGHLKLNTISEAEADQYAIEGTKVDPKSVFVDMLKWTPGLSFDGEYTHRKLIMEIK